MYTVIGKLEPEKWQRLLVFLKISLKRKPLTVLKPGSQRRRFTHISDTVETCISMEENLCQHYSISNKKSYSILDVAKMFNSSKTFLQERVKDLPLHLLTYHLIIK